MFSRRRFGFTLIELMVVMGIIAVLTAWASAGYISARKRAQQTKMIADIVKIQGALDNYFARNRTYPDQLSDLQTGGYIDQLPTPPYATFRGTRGDYTSGQYLYQKDYLFSNAVTQWVQSVDRSGEEVAEQYFKLDQTTAQLETYAYPTTGVFTGFETKKTACAYLRGSGTRTYGYRLGTPLRLADNQASQDATPCSDHFFDVLGEIVN